MATNIRILPENLTNKIAAGEVVERPASVAKELVENALDAGSLDVVVEIESGGKKLIKVSDAGSGMSREDALLALERHATSKIASDEDLFSLSTLGFRGEALPSIASVSRLTISTRTGDSVEGTEIYVEGGRVKEVKGCGMAAGTVISVRNLFFNTPARLKFMKSAETEGGHVGELLTRLAISRPDVRFTYLNDGKVVFRALDADLKERVATMLGRQVAASLHPVSYHDATGLQVTGLVAAPECSRSAASHLYTYINGRFIRDKVVQHAILQAYRNFLERGRYPVVAVFIEIAPGEVDVNVHPTKHEVRFREQGRVHDAIQSAVESVLKETPWLKQRQVGERGAALSVSAQIPASAVGRSGFAQVAETAGGVGESSAATDAPLGGGRSQQASKVTAAPSSDVSAAKVAEVRELLVDYQPRPRPAFRPQLGQGPYTNPAKAANATGGAEVAGVGGVGGVGGIDVASPVGAASRPRWGESIRGEDAAPTQSGAVTGSSGAGRSGADGSGAASEIPAKNEAAEGYFSSLSVLGQFNASYILCQAGTDLIIIDQHAAHERVAFEKLKKEFAEREVESQGLLFPETMELSFQESSVLLEHQDDLSRLGFEVEEFGGKTWLLKGVPQLLAGSDFIRLFRDLLEELGSLGRSRTFIDVQEDILARLACHSVVRGRRQLTEREITALLQQMDGTDFASNCPHGRPVMQKITLRELEKMFKRV